MEGLEGTFTEHKLGLSGMHWQVKASGQYPWIMA